MSIMKPAEVSTSNLVREFAESTSMHGAGRVVGKGGITRKVAWLFVVLTGFGVAIYQVIVVIMMYQTWPVATLITIKYNKELLFPAVTICNMNPIRRSALNTQQTRAINKLVGEEDNTNTTEEAEDSPDDDADPDDDWETEMNEDKSYFSEQSEEYEKLKSIQEIMAILDDDVRTDIGYSLEEMLLKCEFQGVPCVPSNFTRFYNGEFGNCFMFNKDADEWSMVTKTGESYGLTMELYANEGEYVADIVDSVGFKILVHSHSVMPFPEDNAISISPGMSTSIRVSKFEMKRTPPPYSSCVSYSLDEIKTKNMFAATLESLRYSLEACEKTCYQMAVISECDCCDMKLPCSYEALSVLGMEDVEEISFCNTSASSSQRVCTDMVFAEHLINELGCEKMCAPPCNYVDYNSEVSSALWPADVASDDVFRKVNARRKKMKTSNVELPDNESPLQYLRKNVAKIHVFFKHLNHELIESIPSYTWNTLLSDIGGQVGLWLGFSLLTGLEIVELVVDVVVSFFKKGRCASKVAQQKPLKTDEKC